MAGARRRFEAYGAGIDAHKSHELLITVTANLIRWQNSMN